MAVIKMRGQQGRMLLPVHLSNILICADKFIAVSHPWTRGNYWASADSQWGQAEGSLSHMGVGVGAVNKLLYDVWMLQRVENVPTEEQNVEETTRKCVSGSTALFKILHFVQD